MCKSSTTLAAKIWAITNSITNSKIAITNSKIIINSINLLGQIQMFHKNLLHNPNILNNHLLIVLSNDNCIHIRIYSNNPNWILWILSLIYLQRVTCNFKDMSNFILSGFWDWNYCCGINSSSSSGYWSNFWHSFWMDYLTQKYILWLVINIT